MIIGAALTPGCDVFMLCEHFSGWTRLNINAWGASSWRDELQSVNTKKVIFIQFQAFPPLIDHRVSTTTAETWNAAEASASQRVPPELWKTSTDFSSIFDQTIRSLNRTLKEVLHDSDGGRHLSGCLSSSEYVIQIIFHLTGGLQRCHGSRRQVKGRMKGRLKDRREGNIYRLGQTVRGREAIRLSESTQVRGGVRWGPSESFKDVSGRRMSGGCERHADRGLIHTLLLPLKLLLSPALCCGEPRVPGRLGAEWGRREWRLRSGTKWINPWRLCSQLLTQAGFIARQGAINKALWLRGDVLGLSVPL